MTSRDVSVVIVTYNSGTHISSCVEMAKNWNVKEIIVVDNASTDNSAARAESLGVQLIIRSANDGYAQAANEGAAVCSGSIIFFLNPDITSVGELDIRDILQQLDQTDAGVVGLLPYSSDGKQEAHSFGSEPTLLQLWVRKIRPLSPISQPQVIDWVTGAAMLVKTEVFRQVNGFDTGFFLYWEDVDLCRRIWEAGYKVMAYPAPALIHERGASLGSSNHKALLYDKSADRYYRKHYPKIIWGIQFLLRRLYRFVRPEAF